MEIQDKIQICKLVCQAILVDGIVTDDEMELIDKLMDKYDLNDAQKKEVKGRNVDDNSVAMASTLKSQEAKEIVIKEISNAISVDGILSNQEKELIKSVSKMLKINIENIEKV
jgi:uncharacterized tellurite resistance protein B-like protein